jgi:hypothetical protein
MWEATMKLRWCHKTSGQIVLQQQWISSLGSTEWRDVPTEMHEDWRK